MKPIQLYMEVSILTLEKSETSKILTHNFSRAKMLPLDLTL